MRGVALQAPSQADAMALATEAAAGKVWGASVTSPIVKHATRNGRTIVVIIVTNAREGQLNAALKPPAGWAVIRSGDPSTFRDQSDDEECLVDIGRQA